MAEDTIHALATATGRSGVAVIRVSGPNSAILVELITGRKSSTPREAVLRTILSADGEVLDEGLVLFFEAGRSFTGDEVAEFHVHGSRAVISAVLRRITETGLSRSAKPGEFTRRALMNERLDLTQVEGLGALIDAETERQRKAAVENFGGAWGQRVRNWRGKLVEAVSYLEATIDFVDDDVPEDVTPHVRSLIEEVVLEIIKENQGIKSSRILQDGFVVAILGAPNAGKSSLLNALTKSDAAIVTDVPGTTRDVVEVRMDVNGCLVRFLDTAGIRETGDRIEELGIKRAVDRGREADFRLVVLDGTDMDGLVLPQDIGIDLMTRTKCDVSGGFGISALEDDGVEDLLGLIGSALEDRVAAAGLASSIRDEEALGRAQLELASAGEFLDLGEVELASEALRTAMKVLSEIIGEVDIEDILDHIFRSFCIGK